MRSHKRKKTNPCCHLLKSGPNLFRRNFVFPILIKQ